MHRADPITCHSHRPLPKVVLYFTFFACVCLHFKLRRLRQYGQKVRLRLSGARGAALTHARSPHDRAVPAETVAKVLRLNIDEPHRCPRVLFVRTPKTASSSVSEIFFAKKSLAGPSCDAKLFRLRQHANHTYTLSAATLADTPQAVLDRYSQFIGHMNYTTELRERINAYSLYRLATVRSALARLESFMAYEVDRPHIDLFSALQYLEPERKDLFQQRLNISDAELAEMIERILTDFHLVIVNEFLDQSLAVLMHDLRWRAVDVVVPSINVMHEDGREMSLLEGRANHFGTAEGKELFRWILRVDRMLYRRCVEELRRKFLRLPRIYRDVPKVLRKVRREMERVCETEATKKHFKQRESNCIRRYREKMVQEARRFTGQTGKSRFLHLD